MKQKKALITSVSLLIGLIGIIFLFRFMAVTEYTNDISQNFNYFFNAEKTLPKYSETVKSNEELSSSEKELYILYKVGCPYCNASHQYIEQKITKLDNDHKRNIKYVNVSSKAGKTLAKRYNISKAATILVVSKELTRGYVSFDSAMEKNSKIVPNKEEVDDAFTVFNRII